MDEQCRAKLRTTSDKAIQKDMLIKESPTRVVPGHKGGEYVQNLVVVGVSDSPFGRMETGQVTAEQSADAGRSFTLAAGWGSRIE